jgi:hypothetical protein
MKAYLDSEDSYEESIKEELINVKVNRDYAGIGAIIVSLLAYRFIRLGK